MSCAGKERQLPSESCRNHLSELSDQPPSNAISTTKSSKTPYAQAALSYALLERRCLPCLPTPMHPYCQRTAQHPICSWLECPMNVMQTPVALGVASSERGAPSELGTCRTHKSFAGGLCHMVLVLVMITESAWRPCVTQGCSSHVGVVCKRWNVPAGVSNLDCFCNLHCIVSESL